MTHGVHVPYPGRDRRAQHRCAVVDEHRARRIEPLRCTRGAPEFLGLLRAAELVRGIRLVEPIEHTRTLVLDLDDARMGICHQHEALARGPQTLKESARTGQPGDPRGFRSMHLRDIDAQFAAPVVDAIPLHATLQLHETRHELSLRLRERQAVVLGEDLGDARHPDEIVEREIEQGAVEVEQHRVDGGPVRRRSGRQRPGQGCVRGRRQFGHPPMIAA